MSSDCVPLYFGLGDRARLCLQKIKKKKKLRWYIYLYAPLFIPSKNVPVAWNDNIEVVSNCCYVSLAANSPCIPGLKVWNFSFSKNQDIVERDHWYVVFHRGLGSFSFSLCF